MNINISDGGGNESRMTPADAFAELTVETSGGVIRVLIGVQGPGAEAVMNALIECAESMRKMPGANPFRG